MTIKMIGKAIRNAKSDEDVHVLIPGHIGAEVFTAATDIYANEYVGVDPVTGKLRALQSVSIWAIKR